MELILLLAAIFLIAVIMTMTGRGGGNFYVIVIVLFGYSMHEAAATGQFILMISSLSATFLFGKNRIVEWKLVFFIGGLTAASAFFGGYFSDFIDGKILKYIFSLLLLIAAFLMLKPVKETPIINEQKKGYWHLASGEHNYVVNLKLALPLVIIAGFGSGMVGVSGGSFLVPLMVLACNVPMKIAVGTATTMVFATAAMGFIGHTVSGHFDSTIALPLAISAAVGGIIGGKFALRSKPMKLKKLFAYTTLLAAVVMALNALLT